MPPSLTLRSDSSLQISPFVGLVGAVPLGMLRDALDVVDAPRFNRAGVTVVVPIPSAPGR